MVLNKKYIYIITSIFLFLIKLNGFAHAVQFDARDTRIDLPVLSTPNNATAPSMAADDNGHVYLAWSDNRGGAKAIYTNVYFPDSGWQKRAIPITTGYPRPLDAQEGDATSPQVCADNSGHVYVAWMDDRAVKAGTGKLDIYFRYSKDYGITWYPEFTDERIDTDNPGPGNSGSLKMACDGNGKIYIVWEDDRNRGRLLELYFRSFNIQFNKPTDFIVYYQTPDIRINTGMKAGQFAARYPAISTDKNNHVYITWIDNRDKPEEDIYQGIYFNVSNNNGTTFKTTATRLDNAPIAGFLSYSSPVISSDSNRNVYVAWLDNAGRPTRGEPYAPDGLSDVYFVNSSDFGETWEEDQRIEKPNYGEHQATSKDVAIGNNEKGIIGIVWVDDRDEVNNVYFNHSENFGRSFLDSDENIRLDTNAEQEPADPSSPLVKVDKLGNIFVSWLDKRGEDNPNRDIYFNFSIDKGKSDSWQENERRLDYQNPPGNSMSHLMATDNVGHVYIAWQDNRSAIVTGDYNIYFIGGFLDVQTLLIAGQKLGEACFIATAAYGSPYEHHVALLRRFRDSYLFTNSPGKEFVKLYYRFSPPAANYILKHDYLKPVVRLALMPAVGVAAFFVYTSLLQKVVVFIVFLLGVGYWGWKRGRS